MTKLFSPSFLESAWLGTALLSLLATARDHIQKAHPCNRNSQNFEVDIPALNIAFIACRGKENFSLTPVETDARYDLKSGKTEPATEILLRLRRYALNLDPNQLN